MTSFSFYLFFVVVGGVVVMKWLEKFLFQCSWHEVTVLIDGKWISHFIFERSVERSKVEVEAVNKKASERIKYPAQGEKGIRKGKIACFIHLPESLTLDVGSGVFGGGGQVLRGRRAQVLTRAHARH